MKQVKKLIGGMLAVIVLLGGICPAVSKAAEQPFKITTMPENKVISIETGEKTDFTININNPGDKEITEIQIVPQIRNVNDVWPFKTEYQSYQKEIALLQAKGESQTTFDFVARDDINAGRYTLLFTITGQKEGKEVTQDQYLFVNVSKKPEEPKKEEPKQEEVKPVNPEEGNAGAGGVSNGDASYTGGGNPADGQSGSASTPRVIVTGFTTNPEQVKAGSNFTLTIHLKNTSKTMNVKNMLFDLQAPTEGKDEQTTAPAFLPTSGANSIYLDGIGVDGNADISIQLNAKADLVQKPYRIDLSMKYEDAKAAQIESASSISIPIKQDARFEFSDFEITPESVEVGEEANVACNLYNMGRIKLYNVKVIFEGSGIKKEEIFIGNIEAGATAGIDAMLEGKKAGTAPGKVKMTLKYEDEAGSPSSSDKELMLSVSEKVEEDMMLSEAMVEEPKGLPIVPIVIGTTILVAIAIILMIKKRKKSRMLQEEEEGLLDELDRSAEDE